MRQVTIIAAALLVLCIFPTTIYAMQNNQLNIDTSKPLEAGTPESARDAIISYIISRYGLNVEAPTSWTVVNTTPEGLLGYQTLQYTSGDWRVVVKHGVTLTPIYSISIQYTGDNSFTWTGTLELKISNEEYIWNSSDNSTTWTGTLEMKISNEEYETMVNNPDSSIYYTTEDAMDMALKFIQTNHPDATVELPADWVELNLIPEGIMGATKIQYTGGGWTITVSAPVVWKPTYVIEVEYIGVNGFRWSGTLPTSGEIAETTFNK